VSELQPSVSVCDLRPGPRSPRVVFASSAKGGGGYGPKRARDQLARVCTTVTRAHRVDLLESGGFACAGSRGPAPGGWLYWHIRLKERHQRPDGTSPLLTQRVVVS